MFGIIYQLVDDTDAVFLVRVYLISDYNYYSVNILYILCKVIYYPSPHSEVQALCTLVLSNM